VSVFLLSVFLFLTYPAPSHNQWIWFMYLYIRYINFKNLQCLQSEPSHVLCKMNILYYFKYKCTFYTFSPIKKLRCLKFEECVSFFFSKNPHSKTGSILNLRAPYIWSNMVFAELNTSLWKFYFSENVIYATYVYYNYYHRSSCIEKNW
jgi:hypothetical protein